jgi:hypothetical protein
VVIFLEAFFRSTTGPNYRPEGTVHKGKRQPCNFQAILTFLIEGAVGRRCDATELLQ